MRHFLFAAAALIIAAPVAMAQSIPGIPGTSGTNTSFTLGFNGSGSGSASSASGTNFNLSGANGAFSNFTSNGQASSTVTSTPFSTISSSQHTAFAAGNASEGGAFSATNETFGQSNGVNAFTMNASGSFASYENGFNFPG